MSPLLLIAAAGGYLLGSISFGLIATSLGGGVDPRTIGSGNIGATNVLRTGRRDLALITLLGDAGKGAVAVLLARHFLGAPADAVAGAAAFLGHIFPFALGFKGGKGVATFYGVALAAAWPVGLVAAVVWLAVAALMRLSSLAALTAAALAPLAALLLQEPTGVILLFVLMAALIIYRHEANIRRLLKGEEPKIGAKGEA